MPEQYDEIRSMIKSKRTCNYSRHPGEEQARFEKLIKANFDEKKSDKSDEKEEKSSENSKSESKPPKSESESPKSESKPPKNDSEEAQDDFPAPDQPDSGSLDGEIDSSELRAIFADIKDALGEEVAQEIRDIVMEHIDDDEFGTEMEAEEETDPTLETGGMEPFDGGATVIMGVEGDDEPEDEGYVSIRECINLRKSGNKIESYRKEMESFRKATPPSGYPLDPDQVRTNYNTARQTGGRPQHEQPHQMQGAQAGTQDQAATANANQNADKKEEPDAAEQKTTPTDSNADPNAASRAAATQASKDAKAKERTDILQEKSDAWNKQYGANAAQPAAGQARVGGGNNYYSLLAPRMNGQPGLLSRLMQAIRNWRLNRARINQAGQAAASQASQAAPAAQASQAPPQNQGA